MKSSSVSAFSNLVLWYLSPALLLSFVFCSCTPSNVTRLTDDEYDDDSFQINGRGEVVWQGCDSGWPSTCQGGDYEIFFWDGTVVTQITDNDYMDHNPQINDNGWLVWEAEPGSDYEYEIFLYDGTDTTQLTDNTHDDLLPQINNNDWVTWTACDEKWCTTVEEAYRIFLYDGSSTIQLTDNASWSNHGPRMNNRGDVVWVEHGDPAAEIFLYDGANTIRLTDNDYGDYNPEINDNGYIVWQGRGIWLYDGFTAEEISEYGSDAQISNNGEVVWSQYETTLGGDTEIFLYDGTSTIQLTNNSYADRYPQINDDGCVVWRGGRLLLEGDMGALFRHQIFLYDGMETTELANYMAYGDANSFPSLAPKIGADGTVVWAGFGFPAYGWDIYVVVP
jgi:hypothetical protein